MAATRYQNAALFVTLATLFGVAFVAIKAGLAVVPPVLFASLRFVVAAPLLLLFVAWRYDDWLPRNRGDLTGIAVGSLVLVAAANSLLFFGQQSVTPAAASVLFALNPILAPAFAFVLLDDRLDPVDISGILLGLLGVVILVDPSESALTLGSTVGIVALFFGAASNAFGTVLLQRVGPSMDSVPLTAWSMGVGAILLFGMGLGLGESLSGIPVDSSLLFAVLFLGIPSTAVAYPIFFTLVRRIGPVRTNLMSYVVPVVAALVGWVVLNEPVTLATVAGFVVIITGVVLLERGVIVEEVVSIYRTADGRV
jgi:drug/metabolite transporter (DMT)-like permease